MEGCLLDLAKNEVQSLVNLVKNEAQYLCCFNNYVEKFDREKDRLAAKSDDVKKKMKKARGVFSFKYETMQWEHEANEVINIETKTKRFFFGLCPNCWWQYWRGKELAEKTQQIEGLLGRCNSDIVAGRADGPGIKYFSSENFIHFKSRESKFHDLMKALEDDNCNMIGLQGMGGTGKTSMAKEVGGKLKESKFEKVIFLVVSKPPDFKKIRSEIARDLVLTLEEGKEEEHSKTIWYKITEMEEKLLIILDDVWEEFDLIDCLGIPSSHQHKGFSVLITTRNSHVCTAMGCQQTIQLETLNDEDALKLFLAHASINNSSRGLKGVPQKIVKQCGGVPVAIVAIARALKSQPPMVWKDALKALQNRDAKKNLTNAYKCLKLSYDNLKNEKAKELFLISSLFPEDFEIPIQLLCKIGVGLEFCWENDKYDSSRSEVVAAIMELIDSSLFLVGEKECVKMHDLVREVALWIGDKDIQSIMDFKMPIKVGLRYLCWKNDDFLKEFDCSKLEFLLIFLDGSKDLSVPDTFFVEMKRLKVLHFASTWRLRISAPSLLHSLQSLKDIRTLILVNFELGDISILANMSSLETLWLHDCSFIELSIEILKLKRLRWLDVSRCGIEINNPFEVIEKCSQLEELTFIHNMCDKGEKDAISQNVSPLTLHRYQISCKGVLDDFKKDGSISRCFQPDDLRHLISEATFKQLVGTAELLSLGGYKETGWTNLIPDIVPMDDGGMNDLIILHLHSWPEIQCLIDTTNNHYYDVTAFSNLVELHLVAMDLIDLYQGPLPSGFLEQLEILKLKNCQKLNNIVVNSKLNLRHLTSMELNGCPLWTSIFQPSTTQSLMQLKDLIIKNCDALKYIVDITDKTSGEEIVVYNGVDHQKSYDSFPKLKTLQIERCDKLEMIFPVLLIGGLPSLGEISICECGKLKYIFDKFKEEDHAMLPSLNEIKLSGVPSLIRIFRESHIPMSSSMERLSSSPLRDNSKGKLPSPDTHAISWSQVCCFFHKSRTTSEETNLAVSDQRLIDRTIPQGLLVSRKWFEAVDILMRQLLNFRHIKKMNFANLSLNSESLFTLSIASKILWEELTIRECVGLKSIITSNADDYNDQINYISIFPKLEELEIGNCKDLELLFLSKISVEIKNLESLTIEDAPKLNYVVGKCYHDDHLSNQNQNDALKFHLPALEALYLQDLPKVIIKYFTDLMASSAEGPLNQNTKEIDTSVNAIPPFQVAQCLLTQSLNNIKRMTLLNCSNLISLFTPSIASTILLEELTIRRCQQLKCIVVDEGDAGAYVNHNSVFPKLKYLVVSYCDALEYLLPAFAIRSSIHLEYLSITDVHGLKYVFGRSHHEGNSSLNSRSYIDFPALESLDLDGVQNLVSICPKIYCLRGSSLNYIYLRSFSPEFSVRFFIDCMVCGTARRQDSTTTKVIEMRPLQTLKNLTIHGSKTEEIFSLTYLDAKKNENRLASLTSSLQYLELRDLSELRNIWVGPKNILSLNNLLYLRIGACEKLEFVFSASTLRCLPKLRSLYISNCEELVHIIEEDNDEIVRDHLCNHPCFPNLTRLNIEQCNRMKYLFPITVSGILPQLSCLSIQEAANLEHVLIRDEVQERTMKDVLPRLRSLNFDKLPNLVSVCHGIDFQKLEKSSEVNDCFRFSFYETTTTTTQLPDGPKIQEYEVDADTEQKLSSHINMDQTNMGEAEGRRDLETQQSTISSPNSTRGTQEASKEIVEEDHIPKMPKTATSSSDAKFPQHLMSTNKQVGYSTVLEDTHSKKIETRNQLTESEPRKAMTTPVGTISKDESSKAELVCKDVNKETITTDSHSLQETGLEIQSNDSENIVEVQAEEGASLENITSKTVPNPKSPNITTLPAGDSTSATTRFFEEEERKEGDPSVLPTTIISSEQTTETILPLNPIASKAPMRLKQTPSSTPSTSTYARNIQDNVGIINQPSHEAVITMQVSSELNEQDVPTKVSSFYETNNALIVSGVHEIGEMMKLEDVEVSILLEALKTHPQLRLSKEDRSTRMLCISYRVLLDILNILATRTPFTITEADKKSLIENLKDASVLGFDKDWLESVRTKVFNFDASEVHCMQEVLKSLGDKHKTNKTELAEVCDQEAEAARKVEVAQKELEGIRARHYQLSKECQDILEQRDQCWEKITAKFMHFGF